jgi:hypothetical protein
MNAATGIATVAWNPLTPAQQGYYSLASQLLSYRVRVAPIEIYEDYSVGAFPAPIAPFGVNLCTTVYGSPVCGSASVRGLLPSERAHAVGALRHAIDASERSQLQHLRSRAANQRRARDRRGRGERERIRAAGGRQQRRKLVRRSAAPPRLGAHRVELRLEDVCVPAHDERRARRGAADALVVVALELLRAPRKARGQRRRVRRRERARGVS